MVVLILQIQMQADGPIYARRPVALAKLANYQFSSDPMHMSVTSYEPHRMCGSTILLLFDA
jgi:hypothetical protein